MKANILSLTLFLLTVTWSYVISGNHAFADENVKEKAEEAGNDSKRAAKSGARTVKEKVCGLVNGKMECAVQKVKHAGQKAGDVIEDAAD
ncbi:MAG: hypothetical protein H0V66_08220 [Bdellovibrionales bacterium]|nr:hypothetical protein [Bdellovibrionales bacterium]